DNFWKNAPINLASSSSIGVDGGTLTLDSTTNIVGTAPFGQASSTLTKVGTGTLFFTAKNDYLGLTVVANGILNISNNQALGGAGGLGTTVNPGGTLQIQG